MEKFFQFKKYKTNVKTEILAGITTFMTMAYILAVNPNILGATGMDRGAIFTATALCSAIASILMGVLANLPFVLSAGMGLNAYFAYSVVLGMGCSWQLALAAVFVEGIIFIVLSVTNFRSAVFNAIPQSLKLGIGCGIGLYIVLIGLINAGVVVNSDATLITITGFKGWGPHTCAAVLCLIGVIITAVLMHKKVLGSILIGILATWVLGMICEVTKLYVPDPEAGLYSVIPSGIFSKPQSMAPTFCGFVAGLKEATSIPGGIINFLIIVLSFFFVDFFDTLGTLIGCAESGNMLDENHKLRGNKGALMADAVGTTVGAICGTSTITTFIESASGISIGGRTGLTAIVSAIFFLLALFFSPLFLTIPSFATSPALILVGFLMLKQVVKINFEDVTESVPAFLALIAMPYFYSISEGICFGVISYTLINIVCGKSKSIHPILYLLTLLMIGKYMVL